MSVNYYNEFDPKAAAWLRELIKLGAIPNGEVDERSIAEVRPGDLRGFTQCHFFAGIAGWSLGLERAGIPATRPLWSGSCPCQSFSCAGKQKGFADHRDLWPVFFDLIRECRPELVFGEQVENAVRHGWLDRLYADLEGEGYACGAAVLGAHSAGADHIRQRIYWMADAEHTERRKVDGHREDGRHREDVRRSKTCGEFGACSEVCGLAHSEHAERGTEYRLLSEPHRRNGSGGCGFAGGVAHADLNGRREGRGGFAEAGRDGSVGDGSAGGLDDAKQPGLEGHAGHVHDGDEPRRDGAHKAGPVAAAGRPCGLGDSEIDRSEMRAHVHGQLHGQGLVKGCQPRNFWSDAEPLWCRDGKFRRAQPGIFPLAPRSPRGVGYRGDPRSPQYVNATDEARVMRLKGYGNGLNAETAALFLRACKDVLG